MNKKYQKNLQTLRDELKISSLYEDTDINKIIKWLDKRRKFDKTKIEQVGLKNLKDWYFDKKKFTSQI